MTEYIFENYPASELKIEESSTELKEGVLSKVSGPSFFLDGYSRNGRFYPKKLWENALKNKQTTASLDRGLMFGCIGHPKDYSLDELLESGKVSHKVTKIWIDEKTKEGMADYEILDTPSGRILNTVLKSGSDLYVSTRAFGGFSNETKTKDGKKYKILDENNFQIESIDFVINPGFLETNPKLVESIKEDLELLQEDKYDIECEDGLCMIKESIKEPVKETTKETEKIDYSEISKEDIISMFENVVLENKNLSLAIDEDNTETEVSKKTLTNYISYVDFLSKLLRYNVDFEKYYDTFIEFLDKDSNVSVKEIDNMVNTCEEILKIEDLDDSIIEICNKIIKLTPKLKGQEDKKDDSSEQDDSSESKKDESVASIFYRFFKRKEEKFNETIISLKESLEESSRKEGFLISQVDSLKESTKVLMKGLDEESKRTQETKTIIEYKTPEDILEKVELLSGQKEKFNESIDSLNDELKELSEQLENIKNENIELTETNKRLDILEKELIEASDDNSQLKEKIEEDKITFREILEEQKDKEAKLKEDLELLENESVLNKIKYYSVVYKLEEEVVKRILENSESQKKFTESLEKEQKIRRKKISENIKIEEVDFTPQNVDIKKRKFLEGLTK